MFPKRGSGYFAVCFILMMDAVIAGHHHNTFRRGAHGGRRSHLSPHRRDDPIIWPATSGPTSHDYDNNPSSIPSDPAIAAILYGLVKCNHLWVVDLMGQQPGNETSAPLPEYTGTMAPYSIFDASYYCNQVNVTINAGDGPQWAIGYESAYNASSTLPNMAGTEDSVEGAKLRTISGYPTRKFDSSMVPDKDNLGELDFTTVILGADSLAEYLLNRCDETPILGIQPGGNVNVVAHANGNGSYALWAGDSHTITSWSIDDLYDKTSMAYYVSLADFQRWTQSAFAWQPNPVGT